MKEITLSQRIGEFILELAALGFIAMIIYVIIECFCK